MAEVAYQLIWPKRSQTSSSPTASAPGMCLSDHFQDLQLGNLRHQIPAGIFLLVRIFFQSLLHFPLFGCRLFYVCSVQCAQCFLLWHLLVVFCMSQCGWDIVSGIFVLRLNYCKAGRSRLLWIPADEAIPEMQLDYWVHQRPIFGPRYSFIRAVCHIFFLISLKPPELQ